MVIQGVGSSVLKNVLWCFPEEGVYGALVTREIQVKTKVRPNQAPTSTTERSRVCATQNAWGLTRLWARVLAKLFSEVIPRTF